MPTLTGITITEWPLGDVMSQVHDMLVAANGLVYVADNIQDRLYEVDPRTNQVTVYKIPHREGEPNGGLLAARLKEFPRHDSTSNAHSLAESRVDGHIFITPSAQRRLVEFDPETKAFTLHEMDEGFYPHTIRIDPQDRVWFTVALSNQVAMFDRGTQRFKMYDLPTRGLREWLNTRYIGAIFKLMSWGVPLAKWLPVDRAATGTPLPYGIDITPDGKVWFARLHTDEIGSIDPESGEIKMFATPFKGPRRLRTDAAGRLWITAFPESAIARFDPATARFTRFDLPLRAAGRRHALCVERRPPARHRLGQRQPERLAVHVRHRERGVAADPDAAPRDLHARRRVRSRRRRLYGDRALPGLARRGWPIHADPRSAAVTRLCCRAICRA